MQTVAATLLWVVAITCISGYASASAAGTADWSSIDALLRWGVQNHTFPGAVALIATSDNVLYTQAVGNFTYGAAPPLNPTNPAVQLDSRFDLASLTKVLATTTACMTFYQRGELDLDMRLSDPSLLGPVFGSNGKGDITVRNILLHNAGFYPDPIPEFWSPEFGCPESSKTSPAENFSCQRLIYEGTLNQTLMYSPNTQMVYSDLSMITMMYVVGTLARDLGYVRPSDLNTACAAGSPGLARGSGAEQCFYEAYVRIYVLEYLKLSSSQFLPPQSVWPECLPTWNDTTGSSPGPGYRNRVVQGQVSDQNAYALGGIAGHAGLFSTAADMLTLNRRLLFAETDDHWINATTIKTFTTIYNISQSSRALGWDTNNYLTNDYRGCGNFSQTTFTHTGYTGTQVCNDPERGITAILLTNRVYPQASDDSLNMIHQFRIMFSNAVLAVLDAPGDTALAA